LLANGRWFSPGTPASSTTKTGRHDIAEILLKVALKHQKSNRLLVLCSVYYQIFVIINLLFTNFTSINFTFDIDFRNRQFNCLTIYEENRSCIVVGNPALLAAQPQILEYHDGLHIVLFRNLDLI
jgi:hypothetical protein